MHSNVEYIIGKYGLDLSLDKIDVPNVDRVSMMELFGEFGFKEGVEVGTERGVFAKKICDSIPGVHLTCVDPWEFTEEYRSHVPQERLDGFYEETEERLKPYNTTLIRGYSVDAVKEFEDESLDFVYIDGNHEYRYTVEDIAIWTPKVKVGGVISGHDYVNKKSYEFGVTQAVNGFVEAYNISPLFIFGRKDKVEGEKRDNSRSWMFIKEFNPYSNGHS